MANNWFMVQEFRWRAIASGVWTFIFSLAILGGFLFVWIFSPFHHVINICNYFLLLISLYSWCITLCITLLCAMFINIFSKNYAVTCLMERTRLHLISKLFYYRNIVYSLAMALLCGLIAMLMTTFAANQFAVFVHCNSEQGTFRCFNEGYFIFLLFGCILGFTHHLLSTVNQFYTVTFPMVQQGRVLSVKVNLPHYLLSSGKQSATYVKYFLVLYYVLGAFPRYAASVILDYPFCAFGLSFNRLLQINVIICVVASSDSDLIGFGNLTAMASVAWTLWIFGTFLLLVFNLSWHLFNSYLTKMFPFPVDSIFPEDDCRLLTSNLSSSQHILVQHLAFQHLSFIANYSQLKRKQIFTLKFDQQRQRLIKWDIVADECLARIRQLTSDLKDYHQGLSGSSNAKSSVPSQITSPPSSGQASSLPSASVLRRRPLSDVTNTSHPNISYFEVSPSKAANLDVSSHLEQSTLLNGSRITVPTPKLWWARQQKETEDRLSQATNQQHNVTEFATSTNPVQTGRGVLRRLKDNLKQLPFIAYFVKEMPDRIVANIFANHNIYKWAVESISMLVAASLTEDEHGFVQQRLPDIIAALLDLLMLLEKNSKLPITSTSTLSASLLRQQQGLKSETKSALYRISNTFSKYMVDIPLQSEHQRRLKNFLEHRE